MKLLIIILLMFLFSPLIRAESILIVGDSHSCGQFGATMVKELSRKGHRVRLFCTVSSSAVHWLNGENPKNQICNTSSSADSDLKPCDELGKIPRLDLILSRDTYDMAIVALGTNSLFSSQAQLNYQNMAEIVALKIPSCFWIAPPHLRPDQAKESNAETIALMEKNLLKFYASLENRVSPSCHFLNSLIATQSGSLGSATSDGVHRAAGAGKAWAEAILFQLPIR